MGFRSVPKSVIFSDLQQPSGHHYVLFHTVPQLLDQTVSNSLNLTHTVSDKSVAQGV